MKKNENFRLYYQIESSIFENEYIFIYKAKRKQNNDYRAIKVVDKNKIKITFKKVFFREPIDNQIKNLINFFFNEIKNMTILEGEKKENKNAVKIYEIYDTRDELAVVMELCDDNMFNYLINKKNYLKKEDYYNIINQLNNSFEIIDKNNIICGSIKPENILIKYQNAEKTHFYIKLKIPNKIDTILEQLKLSSLNTSISNDFFDCCKAPEILRGEKNINEKSDLWSVGVIIYFLFFKEYPYKGKKKDELLDQIRFGE